VNRTRYRKCAWGTDCGKAEIPMKALQSERRRRRRNRRRLKRETAFLEARKHTDETMDKFYGRFSIAALGASITRVVDKPISGKHCYIGHATGSPSPNKIAVARAKDKTRRPRAMKLQRHNIAVENVHVLGEIKVEGTRTTENFGNPWEYLRNPIPIVTSAEIVKTVKRAGRRGMHKRVRTGLEPEFWTFHSLYRATEALERKVKPTTNRVAGKNRETNKHTEKPPTTGYIDGATNVLSNTDWTLLKLTYEKTHKVAFAILGKLDSNGKRVRKHVVVNRVKSKEEALASLTMAHRVKMA